MVSMKIVFTLLLMTLFASASFAQTDQQLISAGNKLYKQQQFEKAAQEYRKAAEKNNKKCKSSVQYG